MTRNKRNEWVRMVLFALAFASLAAYALVIHSGCKTRQWAVRSQAIIHMKYPGLEAANCTDRYPLRSDTVTTWRFIPGDTLITVDTLVVDCDTVVGPVQIFRIPYTRARIIRDTVEKKVVITKENNAALAAEHLAHKATSEELQKIKGKANMAIWAAVVFGVLVVGLSVIIGRLIKIK